ncbi:hypothetical protein [Aeoliella sp.]|uniref:hypothetical protein n=1 Tax=Aeoliella sp. TaxID=2795800 RepID=UPI003CCBD92B
MAAVISNLNILLKANISGLSKGLDKGKEKIKSFGASVKNLGGRLGSGFLKATKLAGQGLLALGAAATAAVTALAALSFSQFETITQLQRMSQITGASIETLSALGYAARQTGVDSEQLTDAFKEMGIRLGELSALGSGPAVDALARLGIQFEDIKNLSPDQQFATLADALSKVQSTAEKVFLAEELFGGPGSEILPLLDQGSEGLAKFTAEAERLGLVVSKESAAGVVEATQAISKMKDSLKGVGTSLVGVFAPLIRAAANFVTEINVRVTAFFNSFKEQMLVIEFAVDNMGKAWSFVIKNVSYELVAWADHIKGIFSNLGKNLSEFGSQLKSLLSGDGFQFSWDTALGFEESELAKTLKDERDKFAMSLAQDFEKFKADRLKKLFGADAVKLGDIVDVDDAAIADKIKAALRSGAEVAPQFIATGSDAYARMIVEAAQQRGEQARRDKELKALEATREHLRKMQLLQERLARKRQIVAEAANL